MDYFIKKENYKGKKPDRYSINAGHSAPKWKCPNADNFLLLYILITSLYLSLLARKIYMKIIIIYAKIPGITLLLLEYKKSEYISDIKEKLIIRTNLISLSKLTKMQNKKNKVKIDFVFMCNFGIYNEQLAELDLQTK